MPRENERLNPEDAQNEAEILRQKVESGEASDYTEADEIITQEKKEENSIEKQLEAGFLPELLRESWKIVDPESPEARKFHDMTMVLAKTLYAPTKGEEHLPNYEFKHHDFEKEPVRFFLSKDTQPNAWFVSHSKPPIIVFTEGLFAADKEDDKPLVRSPNDFATILCHEMTHLKMRQVYGKIPNSKVEEGFAYSLPLVIMYEKGRQIGLNPEKVIDKTGKVGVYNLMRSQLKENESWFEYLDQHPSADNMHSIVSNTLAYLKKEKGKLAPDVPEVKPYTKDDELIKTVKAGKFETFVEKSLQQHPDYKDLLLPQKLAVLGSVIDNMGDKKWPTRIGDMVKEIRKLRPEVKTIDDRRAVSEFANRILPIGEAGDMRTMKELYSVLGVIATERLESPALGRLRKITRGTKSFIETVREYQNNDQAIVESARMLVKILEGSEQSAGEPFLKTQAGQGFLRSITWPQFRLPSEEKIRRSRRSEEGGARVEWEPLRNLSAQNPDVAKACVYLGLIRDPMIFDGVLHHEDIALKMINAQRGGPREVFGAIPEISIGPRRGSDTLDNFRFNEDGFVVGVTLITERRERFRKNTMNNYLENWIEQQFSNALQDTRAQETLLNLAGSVPREESESRIIGLNVCDKNFPFFLRANEETLSLDVNDARRFLGRLNELGEPGKKLTREFFTSEEGKKIILYSLSGRPFLGYLEGEGDVEGEEAGDIVTNSYTDFLLRDKDIFTPQEKFALCEEYLILSDFAFVGEATNHFQNISSSFDREQARYYLNKLEPLLKAVGKDQTMPSSWGELVSSYREAGIEGQDLNLVRSYLYVEAMQLLDKKTPSIRQAVAFVEMLPPRLLFNSVFQENLREELKDRAESFAAKDASRAELSEVTHLWQVLSKAGVIYPETSDAILKKLVARIEKLNNGILIGQQECLVNSQNLLEGGHIQEPNLRKSLIEAWSNSIAGIYGLDMGEAEYGKKITEIIDGLKINRIDRAEILQALARALQTQGGLSLELQKRAYEITTEAFTQGSLREIFTDVAIDAVRKSPEHRKATLNFLTTPLSRDSCQTFLESSKDVLEFVDENNPVVKMFKLEEDKEPPGYEKRSEAAVAYRRQLAMTALRRFYENFWAAPIEARAVLTRELLISPAEVLDRVDKETFDYAVEKVFTGRKHYEKESRFFLRAYIDALPHYQKHLCLGAIMAAAEKQGTSELRLGETLAYFLENMGPAETKFGQAAQSHPLVPSEIRQDLKRLKFKASEPARWEVTQWVENLRSEIEGQYNQNTGGHATIERIGDVIGSGSINVVADIKMSDNNSYVLSLLRPHAEDRGHAGFETMRLMVDNLNLPDTHEMAQTTRELVDQANERLGIEVDCQIAKQQYSNAKQLYAGTTVTIDNEDYQFNAPDVVASGDKFFLMSKIPGDHYIELPERTSQEKSAKRNYAKAILTLELNNELRGKFDPDRHGGNAKIQTGNRSIGHFDFKSMSLNEWSEEGYRQFAEVLIGALDREKTPEQFFNDLVDQERILRDRLQLEGRSIDPFVTEISKGLLTNGEYTQVLDKHDLMCVVTSALLNGIHPDMQKALLETIASRVPAALKGLYSYIEPAVRHSLETGELTPELQKLLPIKIDNKDLIKIRRSGASAST